jgi:8-hydroxy-5-deazaflavin:NADPH oxidoreductase
LLYLNGTALFAIVALCNKTENKMATKKTVAIIGASGDMGSAIARSLVNSNYRLLLMSRDKTKLAKLFAYVKRKSSTADVAITECEKEACWEADIILMAVPYRSERQVAEKIREVSTQKIVISVSNPLNETHDQLITALDMSSAEELQKALPHSKVVKAFNTVFACELTQHTATEKQIKTFIAGDDKEALQVVSEMSVSMGLKPVLAGSISQSRNLEQMVLQLIELKKEENYNNLIGLNIHYHSPITFKSVIR